VRTLNGARNHRTSVLEMHFLNERITPKKKPRAMALGFSKKTPSEEKAPPTPNLGLGVTIVVDFHPTRHETLASTLALTAEDLTTVLGLHTCTEPELILPGSLGWLVGAFHSLKRKRFEVVGRALTLGLHPSQVSRILRGGVTRRQSPLSIQRLQMLGPRSYGDDSPCQLILSKLFTFLKGQVEKEAVWLPSYDESEVVAVDSFLASTSMMAIL
jgi:hypothetical protein